MTKQITRQGGKRITKYDMYSINGIGEEYLTTEDERIYSLENDYARNDSELYFCQILRSNLGCSLIENIRKFDNYLEKFVLIHELTEFKVNPYLMKKDNDKYVSVDENQLIIMEDETFFIFITNTDKIIDVHIFKK